MGEKFIIGIDLGGTNLRIALLDLKYRIILKRNLSTRAYHSKSSLIEAIVASVNILIRDSRIKRDEVMGVGLGLPGPVDAERGKVYFLPNIPGWKNTNLKKILTKKLRLPVFLDNDAKLMSLAEYALGAARGAKCAICLTLGTGVGGGIVINGRIFRGVSNVSGEIGHLPINEHGPACNCGGRACLEAYIGNNHILGEARKTFKRDISLEELSVLAKNNDRRALRIWSRVGSRLGLALVSVVNLLNPDRIVIGGGVANAGPVLFSSVKGFLAKRAMPVQSRDVKIVKAQLGPEAGMIGAAVLVKNGERQV
ncbi:MAG: ROK family protein [Candidatus Omnitrophica bacterium]|nr:ROK family protein [Candidatus Omnitrophota bacterium]